MTLFLRMEHLNVGLCIAPKYHATIKSALIFYIKHFKLDVHQDQIYAHLIISSIMNGIFALGDYEITNESNYFLANELDGSLFLVPDLNLTKRYQGTHK